MLRTARNIAPAVVDLSTCVRDSFGGGYTGGFSDDNGLCLHHLLHVGLHVGPSSRAQTGNSDTLGHQTLP